MSSTPEGKLKLAVKEHLNTLKNCFYWMPVPNGYGLVGIPDFVGCYKGKFFAIETKAPGGKETPWQHRVRQKIIDAGGLAIVAFSLEEAKRLFDAL